MSIYDNFERDGGIYCNGERYRVYDIANLEAKRIGVELIKRLDNINSTNDECDDMAIIKHEIPKSLRNYQAIRGEITRIIKWYRFPEPRWVDGYVLISWSTCLPKQNIVIALGIECAPTHQWEPNSILKYDQKNQLVFDGKIEYNEKNRDETEAMPS